MTIKICIGTKEGKTLQKDLSEEQSSLLIGKKIGEKVDGDQLEFSGYEFEITGGSDNSGKPMRKDVDGPQKKKIFCVKGIGVHKRREGQKQRKLVCGNTISEIIAQVNLKILKQGKAPLFEKPAEENAEKAEEEKPAENKGE